jgi:deoxycytidylate deaminase
MITLYSTHCPKCKILEKKLNDANIEYIVCDDREFMSQKGFDFMPVLEVDSQIMGFGEAVKWVNERS